ncbi:MAG: HTH domain-containing protein [Deltaproteobacteria bacterium]|nr:HTH domain-containing protein [Deltaproteobacteria bacterium]
MARLYASIMDLARAKHGLTAAALARRREPPVRTVYRDLHALETSGFPITSGDGIRELQRFVLQLGATVEVLEPGWFRRETAQEQLRAARRNQRRPRERLTLDDTGLRDTGRGAGS